MRDERVRGEGEGRRDERERESSVISIGRCRTIRPHEQAATLSEWREPCNTEDTIVITKPRQTRSNMDDQRSLTSAPVASV